VAEECAAGLVCLPPGACGPPALLERLHQLPCQVTAPPPQGRAMKICRQADSECWLAGGELCCHDFTGWSGAEVAAVPQRCCGATPPVLPPAWLPASNTSLHQVLGVTVAEVSPTSPLSWQSMATAWPRTSPAVTTT
jgi:hypothetical protein